MDIPHRASTPVPQQLHPGVGIRLLAAADARPLAEAYQRNREHRGIGSAAVRFVAGYAERELGLHRIQAATLLHNAASRRVLARAGFNEIGIAPEYLKIAGVWQDHLLHQLILQETEP